MKGEEDSSKQTPIKEWNQIDCAHIHCSKTWSTSSPEKTTNRIWL